MKDKLIKEKKKHDKEMLELIISPKKNCKKKHDKEMLELITSPKTNCKKKT